MHVLAPGLAGGVESVVRALAMVQHASGGPTTVAILVDSPRHPFRAVLEGDGVRVVPVVTSARGYVDMFRGLRRVISETAPAIVHTHGYVADVVAGRAAHFLHRRVVATAHGFTGGGFRNRLYERVQRAAMYRADGLIAVSRPLFDRLGRKQRNIWLVRNAWVPGGEPLERAPARALLGLPAEAPVVGWVGRLSHEKGPDVFADAAGMVPGPGVAVLIGEGRERAALEAVRPGPAGLRIQLAGLVPDAARCFRAFDLFVLSSRTEGTPIVLLEAMAAQIPIVATRVGGVPDVVGPDQALLVPPDDPAALAGAIESVLSDPGAARQRATRARERLLAAFSSSAWAKAHEEIYRLVLSRRASDLSR